MAIRVVEFSNGVCKIRKIFASESTYSKEIIEFSELGEWGGVKNWTSFMHVPLGYVDSEAKIFLILYTPVENYTTRIAIMQGNMTTIIFKHFSVSILIRNQD